MPEIIKQGDEFLVPYVNDDGTRGRLNLRRLIQETLAAELGYGSNLTLKERIAYLRNDGGASS